MRALTILLGTGGDNLKENFPATLGLTLIALVLIALVVVALDVLWLRRRR